MVFRGLGLLIVEGSGKEYAVAFIPIRNVNPKHLAAYRLTPNSPIRSYSLFGHVYVDPKGNHKGSAVEGSIMTSIIPRVPVKGFRAYATIA